MAEGKVQFISPQSVLRIHDELLARYGGSRIPGHRSESEGVVAAVMAVRNSYYTDLFDLAAAYAVYIVMGHVFGDGNKRCASGTALAFLALNGVLAVPPVDSLLDLMVEVQQLAESDPRPSANQLVGFVSTFLRSISG